MEKTKKKTFRALQLNANLRFTKKRKKNISTNFDENVSIDPKRVSEFKDYGRIFKNIMENIYLRFA